MNNVERFELLGEEFAEIEAKINTKKALNENNILKYGNMVLEQTKLQIQKQIEAIDEVFPFEAIGKFIKYSGMNSELIYSHGRILIEINFATKKISWKHQSNLNGYLAFYLKVARPEEREVNSISPKKYCEIFGTENPETLLSEAFQNLINEIFDCLEEKLKVLKETNEKMPILDFPFIEKIEKEQERIKIGEFENYEVILEKKGE